MCVFSGLARTVWGFADAYGDASWRGDVATLEAKYFPQRSASGAEDDWGGRGLVGFVQGDAARRTSDGGFTFHGPSSTLAASLSSSS